VPAVRWRVPAARLSIGVLPDKAGALDWLSMLFALDQERRAAWMSSYRVPSHVDWLLVMMAGAAWCSEHQPRPADEAASAVSPCAKAARSGAQVVQSATRRLLPYRSRRAATHLLSVESVRSLGRPAERQLEPNSRGATAMR